MKKTSIITGILCLFFMAHGVQAADVPTSPFTDVAFDAAPSVKVQIGGEEFILLEINGTARASLMQSCEASYGKECQCVFAEKFSELMAKIGQPLAAQATLRLYRFGTHEVLTQTVPVTAANLDEIRTNRELRNELCYP